MSSTQAITTTIDICTSAPGSSIIMGEHAVLQGYPAIVAALDQRIQVQLQGHSSQGQSLQGYDTEGKGPEDKSSQAQLSIQSALGAWQGHWQTLMAENMDNHPLRFVMASIKHLLHMRQLSPSSLNQWHLSISIQSSLDPTLGLGSSAAVTVAVVAAIRQWLWDDYSQQQVLSDSVAIIRQVQGGGSGADVAASCYGGWVLYDGDKIQVTPLLSPSLASSALPSSVLPALSLVSVGYKTPTPQVIALVSTWQQQAPERYKAIYQTMGACVEQAQQAIMATDWYSLADTMSAYQTQMVALGVCDQGTQMAIDAITASGQYQANSTPNDMPWAYKISGSGLGDCVLCLGVGHLPDWPHPQIPLVTDLAGLQLRIN